ncbi:AAA family ATPase [Mucilaginibacter sp. KACC 22773]|uniref:HRDC domain-containing protein n=1 Tax=Mucilaginibacter sp. KACC 22773 TaxID=3025671 RepID=UPI002365BEE1|nr:HRDC domain-containing protein [Mucilaginibacter sp. KACC 22773]WDF78966.1 AAA family ATPase [Mucilaginibacter sp. KACC 22773]
METGFNVQDLAIKFLEDCNAPVFLTGKAGTGKTTLLHRIKTANTKNMAVVAPTAVAAINAGGTTIHSFFQMPIGPLPPNSGEPLALRMSREKTVLLIKLELLIIDEISMVRADTLDYIDTLLRYVKGSAQPFGGVQVLMIGDLFQLPPVWERDWPILGRYYQGPYFFNSLVLQKHDFFTLELSQVYRQTDQAFISILNEIRHGQVTAELLEPLNKHYRSEAEIGTLQDYVTLSTHVQSVDRINTQRLEGLEGAAFVYKADVTGEFATDAYPAEAELVLKVGAQVMFVKNDLSGKKQYFNGRTARVTGLQETSIQVAFLDDHSEFEVLKETWQNVKFALSASEKKINETSAGSFTQYPLRLAWAITIHKSQGLTFDKAVIDVTSAFAAGQTYVALSRCRTLEGIVLRSPIRPENVKTAPAIVDFMTAATSGSPDLATLAVAKKISEFNVISDAFNFGVLSDAWTGFKDQLEKQAGDAGTINAQEAVAMTKVFGSELRAVGDRFIQKELRQGLPRAVLQERINAAAAFFQPKLSGLQAQLEHILLQLPGSELESEFYNRYNYLQANIRQKLAMLHGAVHFSTGADILLYARDALVGYKPVFKNWRPKTTAKDADVENPALYKALLDWRGETAQQKGTPEYSLISEKILREIAKKLPKTFSQLSAIKNFGEQRAQEYGEAILRMVREFLGEGDRLF